jgi:hypothetical protein
MDWMEHTDYCVWHDWQQMLGGMNIGVSEQRNLLEGMLRQEHSDMSRRELTELTERILKMNKELGAGDDGRVKEITETTTTTTTTTTTSTVTQQQRYDTANDFLQLLTTSGGMGFTLEQAKQKAEDIRQGRQDTFVTTHLESKAAKQQTIQAPPRQMQIQSPPPVQQAPPQQPPPQTQTQMQQNVYSPPPPQPQQYSAQNQQFMSQQSVMSPPPQVQIQSPPPMVQSPQPVYSPQPQQVQQQQQQQLYTSQQPQANIQSPAPQMQQSYQSMQSTSLQPPMQASGGFNQQLSTSQYNQPYQSFNTNDSSMTTTSTSTTTTTTDTITSAMQGISLGQPNTYQVQSPAPQQQYPPQYLSQALVPQNQYAPQQIQAQVQSPQPQQQQQQPQLTYPGYAGQQAPHIVEFNQQQYHQSPVTQAQTPLPVANFSQQTQHANQMPGVNVRQPQQQPQYAQATTPAQQWAQSPATPIQQQMLQQMAHQLSPQLQFQQQQQQYLPTPEVQHPAPSYSQANQYQAPQQPQYHQQPAPTQQQGNLPATLGQQAPAQNIQQPPAQASQSSAGKSWLDHHRMGWGKRE